MRKIFFPKNPLEDERELIIYVQRKCNKFLIYYREIEGVVFIKKFSYNKEKIYYDKKTYH